MVRRLGGRSTVLAIVVGVSLMGAAPALGAQRYASPGGSGSACTSNAPCDIVTAVTNSLDNDEVIVAPGSYGSASVPLTRGLSTGSLVNVHGVPGQPLPVIYESDTTGLYLIQPPSTASYLDIEDTTNDAISVAGNIDHVIGRGVRAGCDVYLEATVTNSLCVGGSNGVLGNWGTSGTHTTTLRNDTLIGTGASSYGLWARSDGFTWNINVTNSIVFSTSANPMVYAEHANAGSETITLDHSNFASSNSSAGASVVGTGTNQTDTPLFAAAATGDYHQAPTSPTIDAGIDDPLNGTTDLDSAPRLIGAHTDIGAYEMPLAPVVASSSPSGVSQAGATLNGSVNPGGGATSYHFEYGPTAAYGSSTPTGTLGPVLTAQGVSAPVAGLTPATTYHYRLVATNRAGTRATADQTLTTATVPAPPAPAPTPTPTPAKPGAFSIVGGSAAVIGGRAGVGVSCAGAGPCAGTLTLSETLPVVSKHRRAKHSARRLRTVVIGSAVVRLASGQRTTVAVGLTGDALSRLRSARSHKLKVTVSIARTDAGPAFAAAPLRLELAAKPSKKHTKKHTRHRR